jgi:argininosuccinate lyase
MPNDDTPVDSSSRPLWGSRVRAPLTAVALELSSSTDVDRPLAPYDIAATRAHLAELERVGLLSADGHARLDAALEGIGDRITEGTFAWSEAHEDVHMNVEAAVRVAVGAELAGQLQAGRSRNEEVVTDERLWLRDAVGRLDGAAAALQRTLLDRAEEQIETVVPAQTHTQPAQPTLLAHHLLAYVEMLQRDRGRLADAARRANASPAGSGAAVGSGLPLDREAVAERLGFAEITRNSLDAVADRDYAAEVTASGATTMVHLSRLAADFVLWSTPAYRFVRIGDGHATGSSMLPHKRNPDVAELVRGRSARAQADMLAVLAVQSGLPLGYHRDLQETRAPMQRSVASLELCLAAMDGMVRDSTFNVEVMEAAARRGHALATALAERLLRAGVPFRDAHWRVGELVAEAEAAGCDITELPDERLRAALPELTDHDPIVPSLAEALASADLPGGTAPNRVRAALADARERIATP